MKTSLLFPENAISGNLRWQASWHLAQKMGTDTLYVKGFVRKMSLVLFSSQIPFMLQGQLAFHNTAKFFRQSTQKAVLTPVLQAVPSPPVTNDFELQMTFVCPRARKFPSTTAWTKPSPGRCGAGAAPPAHGNRKAASSRLVRGFMSAQYSAGTPFRTGFPPQNASLLLIMGGAERRGRGAYFPCNLSFATKCIYIIIH